MLRILELVKSCTSVTEKYIFVLVGKKKCIFVPTCVCTFTYYFMFHNSSAIKYSFPWSLEFFLGLNCLAKYLQPKNEGILKKEMLSGMAIIGHASTTLWIVTTIASYLFYSFLCLKGCASYLAFSIIVSLLNLLLFVREQAIE